MPTSPTKLAVVASDHTVAVSKLVRFCALAAQAIGDQEMIQWSRNEMSGYDFHDVPHDHPYRSAPSMLRVTDHFNRTLPASVGDQKLAKQLSRVPLLSPISELEASVANADADAVFAFYFLAEFQARLLSAFRGATSVFRLVQAQAIHIAIAGARQRVFEWAQGLISKGAVLPDEASFEAFFGTQPQTVVADAASLAKAAGGIFINNAPQSPIQIAGDHSTQTVKIANIDTGAVQALLPAIDSLAAQHQATAPEIATALRTELESLRAVLSVATPKQAWVREGLKSLRNIIEGAAGSAVYEGAKAAGILMGLGKLLGLS